VLLEKADVNSIGSHPAKLYAQLTSRNQRDTLKYMTSLVHRLRLASVKLQGKFNPPTYLDTRIDVYAYLVITETSVVLIDTGVGEGNEYIERTFAPRKSSISSELARYGVEPADVKLIVNSHLHFDHCGNNKLFTNAEIFVQERELETARTTLHTVRDWFDYEEARLVPVSGDLEITSGVTLVSSPGHTPGHQSVLVETDDGNVLVAAQAAFTAAEFLRGGDAVEQAHEGFAEQYLLSISRLKSIVAKEVYFSHDNGSAVAM
jgi:N-acyl homoserine lactone hydrolase